MTNSIDSAVDGAIHRIGERRNPARAPDGASGARDGASGKSADLLDLTGRARELRALQQELARSPAFDTQRVDALKDALASGRYEVDAERIADKLLALEAKLP